jgi:hypothetical protein
MPSIMSPDKKLTAREHMHETSQVALFSRYLNSQEKLKKFQTVQSRTHKAKVREKQQES